MRKKDYNSFYFNSSIINEEQYEVLIKNIMNSMSTDDRNVMYNYFINNRKNTNVNYRPHISPIKKIIKSYSIDDIQNKLKKIYGDDKLEVLIEDKLDGIMINLIYYDGCLKSAITRGDCNGGEDIIDVMKEVVKPIINFKETLEIRGELTMHKNDYIKYFSDYSSSRHAMLSIISKKTLNPIHLKKIVFYAHDIGIISKKLLPMSQSNVYKYLCAIEFKTVNYLKSSISDLQKDFNKFESCIDNNLIRDGYIVKVNSVDLQLSFFEKYSQESAYIFAYKKINIFQTFIKNIELNFGKNGICVPIANIEPQITFENISCNKINLYSHNFITSKNIAIGNKIQILFKAIFVFDRVISRIDKSVFKFPDKCYTCSSELKTIGLHLCCININCPNKIVNTLTFLCKQIGIRSIAKQTIKTIVEKNIIKSILDIFNIKNKLNDLMLLKNFQDKKIINLVNAINLSIKKISLEQIILCFGIPSIGQKTANNIASEFIKNKKIDISKIEQMSFLNKKQKEEVILFFQNDENKKISQEIIKTCLNQ